MSASVVTDRSHHPRQGQHRSLRDCLLAAAIACGTLAISAAQAPARMRRPILDGASTIGAFTDNSSLLRVVGERGAGDAIVFTPHHVASVDTAHGCPLTIAVTTPGKLEAGIQTAHPAGGRWPGKP